MQKISQTFNRIPGLVSKKIVVVSCVLLWAAACILLVTYHFWGASLVADVYHERSFSFLNQLLGGRDQHSLEFYYAEAARLVYITALSMLMLSVAICIVYLTGKKTCTRATFAEMISVRRALVASLLVLVCSAAPLYFAVYPPLHDYPFHIARVYILANWHQSSILQHWYDIGSFIMPNMAMDLVALSLAKVLPIEVAGRAFIALTFGLTLSGCMFLYRCIHGYFAVWPLVSALFLFNWILLFGFLNYLFGVAILLWAVGIWILLSDSAPWVRLFCGTLLSIILFFCHLAALGLYAITLAGFEVQRSMTTLHRSKLTAARDLLIGASVFVAPFILFFMSSTADKTSAKIDYIASPIQKVFIFMHALRSADWVLDYSMLFAVVTVVIVVIFVGRLSVAKSMILPLAMLIGAFLVMPRRMLSGEYVDIRLPVVMIFMAISATQLKLSTKAWHRIVISGLAVVLVFRSVVISYNWHKYDQVIEEFTDTFATLPANSIMFVVSAAPDPGFGDIRELGFWQPPVKHVVSLATLHQSIFVPATWAFKSQQPITIKSKYSDIQEFQGFNPIQVKTHEELEAVTERIRSLVAVTVRPAVPTFILVLHPRFLNLKQPNRTRVTGSGRNFLVLQVMEVGTSTPPG